MLTPADVEQKTFSTALRGYDLDEVDDFLDDVVATIRSLTEQLEEARSGVAAAPSPSAPTVAPAVPEDEQAAPEATPAEPAPRPDVDESAIGRALVAAQTAADRLLEEAQAQAENIVEGAQSEADSWTAEREEKRRQAEAEISALAARVASVRAELSVLAGEVAEKLDDMDSVIEAGQSDADEVAGAEDAEDTATGLESPADEGSDQTEDAVVGGEEGAGSPGEVEASYDDEEYEFESGQSEDESGDETDEESGSGYGSDQLDEILTGVAADLQLGARRSDDSGDRDDSPDGDDSPEDGDTPDKAESPEDEDTPDEAESPEDGDTRL